MPKCSRCGKTLWRIETVADGLCDSCRMILENNEIRIDNYNLCRDKKAPSPMQRIYDAFIAKYPNALITGISIKDDGKRLLFYLDGYPAYYVTLDPLMNSVDISPYIEPLENPDTSSSVNTANAVAKDSFAKRCNTLSLIVSILSCIASLSLFAFSASPIGIMIFGAFSLVSMIGSLASSSNTCLFAGCMMALIGIASNPFLIIPGLLIIYSALRF